MKKLLLLAFVFITTNVFASSIGTHICIQNKTDHYVWITSMVFEDAMWDGQARPDINLNKRYIEPNGYICEREELNTSSSQLREYKGAYGFILYSQIAGYNKETGQVFSTGVKPTYSNAMGFNYKQSQRWGMFNNSFTTSLDYGHPHYNDLFAGKSKNDSQILRWNTDNTSGAAMNSYGMLPTSYIYINDKGCNTLGSTIYKDLSSCSLFYVER